MGSSNGTLKSGRVKDLALVLRFGSGEEGEEKRREPEMGGRMLEYVQWGGPSGHVI